MKRLEIIVTPGKLDDVKRALLEEGVQGMTINRSEGFTWDKGQKRVYRGQEYTVDTVSMVTINSVVDDAMVDGLLKAVTSAARTGGDGQGRVGDGKIFVHDVAQVVRIHTGATGADAIARDTG